MAKPGRPSPGLDDYLYWQERLSNREASGLSIDEFLCRRRGFSLDLLPLGSATQGGDPGCGEGGGSESHLLGDFRAEVSAGFRNRIAGRD